MLLFYLFRVSFIRGCATAIPDSLWLSSAEEEENLYPEFV